MDSGRQRTTTSSREMNPAYITATGAFLPGTSIPNERMEEYIGRIGDSHSRLGRATLRRNGIQQRHYARDNKDRITHTNAELAAAAIRETLKNGRCRDERVGFLATGTTQGDLLVPGFASAVQAELGIPNLEVASFQSVCASSLMAVKMAMLTVRSGECAAAVASGSESACRWFQPRFYSDAYQAEPDPGIEFLRWTLSDGAGAVLIEPEPAAWGRSLRIDWIEQRSFADRFPACMYAGMADNRRDTEVWSHYPSPGSAHQAGAMALKQDLKLLYQLFPVWMGYYLEVLDKHGLDPNRIDAFLPHYSAESLAREMQRLLEATGAMIPTDRWFNNLKTKGNTGSASIFIMLDEWFRTCNPQPGQQVLCFVPESGRALAAFMHLTVV